MTKKDDSVSLPTGAGSGASLRFINDQIITRFGNPILNELEDGSFIPTLDGRMVVTTDSYIVNPPIFPGGDIGRLAISGTVNDLVASGAKPLYLTIGLILSEGFAYKDLITILDSAAYLVKSLGVYVIAGDTKVIEKGAFSSIIINTTGLGKPINQEKTYALSNAQIGDLIIVTGTLGDHGLAILSLREGLGFEQRVTSDCAPLANLILPLLGQFEHIHSLRDLTRGGLLNALNDLVDASQKNVTIDSDQIPVRMEVKMGCEMLGLDPLSMLNEGKMLIIVGRSESYKVLDLLKRHPLGENSAIIGEITRPDSPRARLLLKENNRVRIIDRFEGDSIPRLC